MTISNDFMEPMELTDAMLDGIVGGLTKSQRTATEKFARDAQRNGLTLDEAIDRALNPRHGSCIFTNDMIQHLTSYWNETFA